MYVAMVTTVMGLIVGIPAYFGYNYLVARIEKLVFQMEANSIAFMDILNQPFKNSALWQSNTDRKSINRSRPRR